MILTIDTLAVTWIVPVSSSSPLRSPGTRGGYHKPSERPADDAIPSVAELDTMPRAAGMSASMFSQYAGRQPGTLVS